MSDPVKRDLILGQFSMITRPYTRPNGLKTLPLPDQMACKPYSLQRHIPVWLIYGSTPLPRSWTDVIDSVVGKKPRKLGNTDRMQILLRLSFIAVKTFWIEYWSVNIAPVPSSRLKQKSIKFCQKEVPGNRLTWCGYSKIRFLCLFYGTAGWNSIETINYISH